VMDELEASGARIAGESPADVALRRELNAALPDTARGHRDRIMHGAQAAYPEYAYQHPEEPVLDILFKPEAPLTVFDYDGAVYRLETVVEALKAFTTATGLGLGGRASRNAW